MSWSNRVDERNHLTARTARAKKYRRHLRSLENKDHVQPFVSMDVTSSASQQERFVNRRGQFVVSQKVEMHVKNLSQDVDRQLEQTKTRYDSF